MRTTLNIDDELLARAAELTGITEKTSLVRRGLQALIEMIEGFAFGGRGRIKGYHQAQRRHWQRPGPPDRRHRQQQDNRPGQKQQHALVYCRFNFGYLSIHCSSNGVYNTHLFEKNLSRFTRNV